MIASVLILGMTYCANRLDWAISAAQALDMTVPAAFRSIGYLVSAGSIEAGTYWGNLAMLYLFTLLGAVPTIINGIKANQQPAIPEGQAGISATQTGPAQAVQRMAFYPPIKSWTVLVRIGMAAAMLMPLIAGAGLLFVGDDAGGDPRWMMAAAGAFCAFLLGIFVVLPDSTLLQSNTILMVRGADGTLWQVQIHLLNAIAFYRFTAKTGVWRALSWERLSPEEQRLAEESIARAIEDISLGRIFKGNAVLPLTNLALVREDRWQWKITYQLRNGRKTLHIAKIYPGLCLSPDDEPMQGPLPLRWRTCAVSVLCTLALMAGGWGLGTAITNGALLPARPGNTAASVPESTTAYMTDRVTYQIDDSFQPSDTGDNEYYDPATGAQFAVSVGRDIDEADATDLLLEPVSQSKDDETYDGFRLDRTDTEDDTGFATLTAQNGETYRYNILSVYFTSGEIYHRGLALSKDDVLIMAEAWQDTAKNEETVKSDLLAILESAEIGDLPDTSLAVQEGITEENYQRLVHTAKDFDASYIDMAYIKAPDGMFDAGSFLSVYIPHADERSYSDDGGSVQSTAHGMQIGVTVVPSAENAEAVVDAAYQELADAGTDFYEEGVYDTVYEEADDIAYKQITYFEDDGANPRVAILYADARQAGYYLRAQITYLPEQIDAENPTLVGQLSDVFGLTLPVLDAAE